MNSSARRFELLGWAVLPGAITVLLVILCLVPKHLPGLAGFMPLLPLIAVFYWGMAHARAMPYWFVFMTGLLMDAGSYLPLGTLSLLYMLFLALVHAQRKTVHKEGFVIKWGYFGLLLGMLEILDWAVLSMFDGRVQDGLPAFFQWFLTLCSYPLLARGFDTLHEHMSMRRWKILHGH